MVKPMKAVYLGFCFASAVMLCKRKIMLKSLLQIKGSNRTQKYIANLHFSRRFIDYKRDIKPLLTVRGRLLARLFKLVLMKPIKTSPNPYALLNVGS